MSANWTKLRSDLANAVKYGAPESTVTDLRRDLRAARLADAIQRTVTAWPPLTDDQKAHLAGLLRARSADAA